MLFSSLPHSPLGHVSGRSHQVLLLLLNYKLAIFTTIEILLPCIYFNQTNISMLYAGLVFGGGGGGAIFEGLIFRMA